MIRKALLVFLQLTVLCGILYPLLITLVAQLAMPYQANGSMTKAGSELIAQRFTHDNYFWPRPSAVDYNPIRPSGGSNLGPTSQRLHDLVSERLGKYGKDAPADLLYASGSGIDPHISTEAALFQTDRVAKARVVDRTAIQNIVLKQAGTKGYVNVLLLNIELDKVHD
ncbi:MAG: potassium-transporting ATPase subunit C [Chlamydiales bacterium]|nr:potassium-transporting ATPase subunit C [Chlamydiales bacterium]